MGVVLNGWELAMLFLYLLILFFADAVCNKNVVPFVLCDHFLTK